MRVPFSIALAVTFVSVAFASVGGAASMGGVDGSLGSL